LIGQGNSIYSHGGRGHGGWGGIMQVPHGLPAPPLFRTLEEEPPPVNRAHTSVSPCLREKTGD
jgi:hypothetical protein